MRRLLIGILLVCFAAATGAKAGASHQGSAVVVDRHYGSADHQVLCHVHGRKVACSNGRHTLQCDDDLCSPAYGGITPGPGVDNDLDIDWRLEPYIHPGEQVVGPPIKGRLSVFRRQGAFRMGPVSCRTLGRTLACRLAGAQGGFELSHLFLRLESYDDAPSGWPWDHRRHNAAETMPPTAFINLTPPDTDALLKDPDSDGPHLNVNEVTGNGIVAKDGAYATTDGKVLCRVYGPKVACTNGQATVQCGGSVCAPRRAPRTPGPAAGHGVEVVLSAMKTLHPAVLRPGISWGLGFADCRTTRTMVQCRLADGLGGFQMDGLFARIDAYEDAPAGWPWDGKRHTAAEGVPGV